MIESSSQEICAGVDYDSRGTMNRRIHRSRASAGDGPMRLRPA